MKNVLTLKRFVLGPLFTNCYLVCEEATRKGVLIDPAAPSPEIRDYVRAKKIEVLYSINTHGHADHIAGDLYFGYPVLIHSLDEECLKDPVKNLSGMMDSPLCPISPQFTIASGDRVEFGNSFLTVIHTPGHTPGSISLLCKEMLFSGDTLFFEGVGRTDLPGGSFEDIKASIQRELFGLPGETIVLPGHGEKTTISHEKNNNPFLR